MMRARIMLALRLLLRIGLLIGVILLAQRFAGFVEHEIPFEVNPANRLAVDRAIAIALVAYIVLMALPFVPAAEIGMTLLGMFGASVAPLVYLGTVTGLSIAYAVGRLIPPEVTARILRRLHLVRAADLIVETGRLPKEARVEHLLDRVDNPAVRALSRYRYVALIVLLNLPGNVLIGGGGGIAMAAGMSGVFPVLPFLGTVLVAVLPVPLAVLSFAAH